MSDEISRLKEEARQEQNNQNGKVVNAPRHHGRHDKHREASSITGPLILILLGIYFLMRNLGYTDLQLNWWIFARFWPLFLIFAGLNIVAGQIKGGFGTLIRALISLGTVTIFGALLLFGDSLPFVQAHSPNVQLQEISVERQDTETAAVEINFSNAQAELSGLVDSNDLLAGTVSYVGDVRVNADEADGFTELSVDTDDKWFWGFSGQMQPWKLGLNTAVPLDLKLNLNNGPTTLDLSELTLTNLDINAGNGSTKITLPSGDYDMVYDGDNGGATIILPAEGSHYIIVNGGNGSINFTLPATIMEARITVNDGNGSFTAPEHMRLVSGERNGDGVWETPGFDPDRPNVIDMEIDVDNGSIRVEAGDITGR